MITVLPSTILYDDQSKDVGAMRWLDCYSDQPEAAKVMYTRQSWSTDMCLMKNDNQVGRKSVARLKVAEFPKLALKHGILLNLPI